jgi:hypothetical protein
MKYLCTVCSCHQSERILRNLTVLADVYRPYESEKSSAWNHANEISSYCCGGCTIARPANVAENFLYKLNICAALAVLLPHVGRWRLGWGGEAEVSRARAPRLHRWIVFEWTYRKDKNRQETIQFIEMQPPIYTALVYHHLQTETLSSEYEGFFLPINGYIMKLTSHHYTALVSWTRQRGALFFFPVRLHFVAPSAGTIVDLPIEASSLRV